MAIEADAKDWTWAVERACPQCGFDPTGLAFRQIPGLLRDDARRWGAVLAGPAARIRPDESTWSPLEYAAHVRDMLRVFTDRFALMLAEEDPTFENWDQDAAAVDEQYNEQDAALVALELAAAADEAAAVLDAVTDADLGRPGRRGDGAAFTVESLARYVAHECTHHLWDVTRA
jgi:DinB family protein